MKSWIRKVIVEDEDDESKRTDSKPVLVEEAAQAAKEAAAAATEMAKVSRELLTSKSEGWYCITSVLRQWMLYILSPLPQ